MKPNRKQRRARNKQSKKRVKGPTPKSASKMTAQERAEALNIGIETLIQRYAQDDLDLANMSLASVAAVTAVLTGDSEDVFIARMRTMYQQVEAAAKEQQRSIITNPSAGRLVGPDGAPV